jgi:S-adenosylmethionine/arginine decarboxylase-like enzyme
LLSLLELCYETPLLLCCCKARRDAIKDCQTAVKSPASRSAFTPSSGAAFSVFDSSSSSSGGVRNHGRPAPLNRLSTVSQQHSRSDSDTFKSDASSTKPPVLPVGRHILLEYYKIPQHAFAETVTLSEGTRRLQRDIVVLIQQAGMTSLGQSCHVFPVASGLPAAVTCLFLLSESHISLHTWPEHGYAGNACTVYY